MSETIILAIIIARIKKYDVKLLFKAKEIYIVLFFELIYLMLQLTIFDGNYSFLGYTSLLKSLYLCSYLGLIFKHELYKEAIIGAGFVLAGGMLNDIAIAANHGKMPAFPTFSYLTGYIKEDSFEVLSKMGTDIHVLGDQGTNLKWLTDIIDLGYGVLSIGDVLIRVFVFMIIYYAIRDLNKKIIRPETIVHI